MRVSSFRTHAYEINAAMNSFQMFVTIAKNSLSLFEPLAHKPPISASMYSIQTGKKKNRFFFP